MPKLPPPPRRPQNRSAFSCLRCLHDAAVGGHDFGLDEVVAHETELALEPAAAAARARGRRCRSSSRGRPCTRGRAPASRRRTRPSEPGLGANASWPSGRRRRPSCRACRRRRRRRPPRRRSHRGRRRRPTSGRFCSRARFTAARRRRPSVQRAISAGLRSIIPLKTERASSYSASPGWISLPPKPGRSKRVGCAMGGPPGSRPVCPRAMRPTPALDQVTGSLAPWPSTVQSRLTRLADEPFDVLVVGGGITGTGVALDAASRGLRTALIDKGDFASGHVVEVVEARPRRHPLPPAEGGRPRLRGAGRAADPAQDRAAPRAGAAVPAARVHPRRPAAPPARAPARHHDVDVRPHRRPAHRQVAQAHLEGRSAALHADAARPTTSRRRTSTTTRRPTTRASRSRSPRPRPTRARSSRTTRRSPAS